MGARCSCASALIPGNTRWDEPAGSCREVPTVAGLMDMISGLVNQASGLLGQVTQAAQGLLSSLGI